MAIKLGHRPAVEHYCLKAGGRGRKLFEEYRLTHPPTQKVEEETEVAAKITPSDESLDESIKL